MTEHIGKYKIVFSNDKLFELTPTGDEIYREDVNNFYQYLKCNKMIDDQKIKIMIESDYINPSNYITKYNIEICEIDVRSLAKQAIKDEQYSMGQSVLNNTNIELGENEDEIYSDIHIEKYMEKFMEKCFKIK
jgi:hypothetical protein